MARRFKDVKTGRHLPGKALYPNWWPPNLRAHLYHNRKNRIEGLTGGSSGPVITPQDLVMWAGDSITARRDMQSFASWSALHEPRLRFTPKPSGDFFYGTIGVGGDNSSQFLSRVPGFLTSFPTMTHMFAHIGTNDLSDEPTATIVQNLTDAFDLLIADGVVPIWLEILPRLSQNEQRAEVNGLIRELAASRGDFYTISAEGSFDPADETILFDGLHPTPKGASIITKAFVEQLSFTGGLEDYLPTNRMTNPDMTGDSGATTGSFSAGSECVDDYYVQNDTDVEATAEIIQKEGRNFVRLSLVGTPTTGSFIQFRRAETSHGGEVGEYHEGTLNVKVTASDGVSDPVGVETLQMRWENSRSFFSVYDPTTNGPVPAFEGTLRSLPQLIASTETGVNFQFQIWVFGGVPVDVQFEVGIPWTGNAALDEV